MVATAGTTVFLPRNLPHAWEVVGDTPVKTLLQIFPGGTEKMWQEISALAAEGSGPPDMGQVVALCARYGVIFLPPPSA